MTAFAAAAIPHPPRPLTALERAMLLKAGGSFLVRALPGQGIQVLSKFP